MKYFLVASFLLTAFTGVSQHVNTSTAFVEASLGAGSYKGTLTVAYLKRWGIGKNRKLGVGAGVRFTSFIGSNQYYSTAPARLTSESTSPLIFFKENIVNNIDSLLVKSPQVNALNVCINFDYRVSEKMMVGFNIDAIGFSFGGKKQGNYINGVQGKVTDGTPTTFNVLLISDNDRGTLNSELYARYFFNERWGVKAGLQFLFTEYTTTSKVQQAPSENDRFRNKALLFSLGISYQLKSKS